MAFNANDYYTVTNGVKLYGYWNPFVTKYNSTSFYNWEQDNLPMYDLEERTSFLWERSGWATSSVPGLALVVEDTKDPEDNNSFGTLQEAIDALPDVIRQPVMIEVIATGDLGKLELKNIKFGEGGALEILNSAKIDVKASDFKGAGVFSDTEGNYLHYESIQTKTTGGTPVSDWLNSAKSLVKSDVLGSDYNLNSNGVLPNLGVLPGVGQFEGGYFIAPTGASDQGLREDKPSMYAYQGKNFNDNDPWATTAGNNLVTKDISNLESAVSDPTNSLDLTGVTKRSRVNTAIELGGGGGTAQSINGIWTNNVVRSIVIQNCDGPIYIRGFLVDGSDNRDAGAVKTYDKYGIAVHNSQHIYIEGCASMRNSEGGLLVQNSDVVLNRKFLTGRNHSPASTDIRQSVEHFGIKVINSSLTLSSDSECYGSDSMFLSFENDYGIYLENSKLFGVKTSATDVTTRPVIRSCYNAKAGVYAAHSKIEVDCDFDIHSNQKGVWLVDSDLKTYRMFCQYSVEEGLLAEGSKVIHGKLLGSENATTRVETNSTSLYTNDGVPYDYDVFFFGNANQITLKNSEYLPLYQDDMENQIGAQLIACHTGTDNGYFVPAVKMHNSMADFIHCRLSTTKSYALGSFYTEINPAAGANLGTAVDMVNSKVAFLGTSKMATVISGPSQLADHNGLYISKNSTCRLSGPTFITNFKKPVIVDENSTLDVCPHSDEASYGYPVDAIDLSDPSNHTSLEIFSYGTCLIADNNSVINMKNLGCSEMKYPDYLRDSDMLYIADTSAYHYAGGVMLAPNDPDGGNPAGPGTLASYKNAPNTYRFVGGNLAGTGGRTAQAYNYYFLGGSNLEDVPFRDNVSKGGVCVQALNNSVVNVFNVAFHTGDTNADGVVYEKNSGLAGCNQLRIWAFGTGSTLNAGMVSVSGTYPSLAGYHGPRAVYFSSYGVDGERPDDVVYTAFRSYPYGYTTDTSTGNLLNYPDGKVTNIYKQVDVDDYCGSSIGRGTSPYVSGLAVLDYFGSGTLINGYEGFDEGGYGNGGDYTKWIRSQANSRYDSGALQTALTLTPTQASRFYGASGYENTGPFRLYLEPDPICQYMSYMSGLGGTGDGFVWGVPSGTIDLNSALSADNRPYQTISQGYHLSGPVVIDSYYARVWRPEMRYWQLGNAAQVDTLQTSGYPDIADLVRPENYNIRLDESAAHMFANAKHCSIPFLGRPPLVEIYRNSRTHWGSRMGNSVSIPDGYGKGFKSPFTFNTGRR
jgi:hypothetical protein